MEFKAFHGKIVKEAKEDDILQPPVVRQLANNELDETLKRVKIEVRELVESEIKRILRYPGKKGML